MPPVWFEQKREKTGFIGLVKPIAWQGWAIHLAMVFALAMLAQMIGGWALLDGFRPVATGVWLIGGVFMLLGFYFRAVSYFSGPKN